MSSYMPKNVKNLMMAVAAGALVCGVLAGCAPTPYVKAHQEFWAGKPADAETTLQPVAAQELQEDGRNKNVLLWDLGVYQFNQGKYDEAIETFKASVTDIERLRSTGEKIVNTAFKSASSLKYMGDPIEISVAYSYLGAAFYMTGDYENALVAFRRSTEEDLSGEAERQGDMRFANFCMAETYMKQRQYDDAVVGYRRVIKYAPDMYPAYAGMYEAATLARNEVALGEARDGLERLRGEDFVTALETNPGQGITVIMLADQPDAVTRDAFTGSFRQRKAMGTDVSRWQVDVDDHDVGMDLADNMHEHFKDQGGFKDDAKNVVAKQCAASTMKQIPCVGLFAPDTSADIRYWQTMPGKVYVAYVPMPAETVDMSIAAYNAKDVRLNQYDQRIQGLAVEPGTHTMVFVSKYVKYDPATMVQNVVAPAKDDAHAVEAVTDTPEPPQLGGN